MGLKKKEEEIIDVEPEEVNKIKQLVDKLALKVSVLALKVGMKAGASYPVVKQYQTDAIEILKNPKLILNKEEEDEVPK